MITNSEKTTFHKIDGKIEDLVTFIDSGDMALPELQRPFVWNSSKVRDLFDSMYKGLPIGYFLFWENERLSKTHHIGNNKKVHVPKYLIIDGQQRLTALYSVFKNKQIMDKNYTYKKIKIGFNIFTQEFVVATATTEKNKEFIDDISKIYQTSSYAFISEYQEILSKYLEEINERKISFAKRFRKGDEFLPAEIEFVVARLRSIDEPNDLIITLISKLKAGTKLNEEELAWLIKFLRKKITIDPELVATRIEHLAKLTEYPYQALEIFSHVEEEKVAEIFTRINSKGVTLNQSDFVLTLISVFWEDGRKAIDEFCRQAKQIPQNDVKDSPFNHIIKPEASEIVRTVVGIGFKRARMKDAYALLKGRNMNTRKYSVSLRNKQFDIYKTKQEIVLNNKNWHNFLKILLGIGFKNSSLISSSTAVINSYIFYLIGKNDFRIDEKELEKLIGRWFFMANLTSRYSGSSETIMEGDFNKIKPCKTKNEFTEILNNTMENTLTNDFWNITLPKDLLVSSAGFSPLANTFYACLIKSNVNALFSERKVADLYDPTIRIRKKSLDKHHIFPQNYLAKKGFDKTSINQIANLTYLEYLDNIKISDSEPMIYFNHYLSKYFSGRENELYRCMYQHAIPKDFYDLEYDIFLEKRRNMMARVMKISFEKI